ncbi:MAG: DUF58 domain-containing protein [Bacteroidia bacterium]|nr:DUF58 domain-containing protein [Bacteroidia bacterium]
MLASELTALHARVRHLEIRVRRRVASTFAGAYRSVFKGAGLEFDEVRQYSYGDDIRLIDWNVTARNTHDVYVKVFREERQLSVWVLLDVSASQQFGVGAARKARAATDLTALIGLSAQANGDRFGLIAFSDAIEWVSRPSQNRKHLLAALARLLSQPFRSKQTSLKTALEFARRVQRRRSVVFIISDFLDQGYQRALIQLARKHEVNCIRLYHPDETRIGRLGMVPIEALESGQTHWLASGRLGLGPALAQGFAQHGERLAQLCTRYGMHYLALDTTQDPVLGLEQDFLKRKRMRYG